MVVGVKRLDSLRISLSDGDLVRHWVGFDEYAAANVFEFGSPFLSAAEVQDDVGIAV
jgi:hypothetical protein